jgi:hypothetical protein
LFGKNYVLVVQAQEEVDQEVNHPISPLGALGNRESEKNTLCLLFPRGLRRRRYQCVALRGFWQRVDLRAKGLSAIFGSQPSKPFQLAKPAKPYFPFMSFQYEMYITPNVLLLYRIQDNVLVLVRIGTHSNLFN